LEVNLYKHILIATDGSELAGKAVSAGLTLAKALGAKVTAVNATEPWTAMVTGEAALAFPIEECRQDPHRGHGRRKEAGRYLRHGSRQRLPGRGHHRDGEGQRL
jgi:nucleotide-binding universal stress UspA family protein